MAKNKILSIKERFKLEKGIDKSSLERYYNPKPYSKVEFYLAYLNPFLWFLKIPKIEFDSKEAVEHHNSLALKQLKLTSKRTIKFELRYFFAFLAGYSLPLIQIPNLNTIITYALPFCGIIIVESFLPQFAGQIWYLIILYTFFVKCIINSYNLNWRANDEIETSKLIERNILLEQRLARSLIDYIYLNLSFALIIKWFFINNYTTIKGSNLESILSWISLAFENMLIITTFLDITGKSFPISISDIEYKGSLFTSLVFSLMAIYNIYIASATVKLTLKLVKTNFTNIIESVT